MTVKIQLPPQIESRLRALQRLPEQLLAATMQTTDLQNELTIGKIQGEKLSKRGPTTLGVVTNRLRSSVSKTPAQFTGDAIVSSIGSNVRYAAAHEFGYTGPANVRSHTRRQAKYVFGGPNPKAGQPVTVRAHKRSLKIVARRPFGQGIDERQGAYAAALGKTVERIFAEL